MARKKVREYDAKRVLKAAFARLLGCELRIQVAQVKEAADWGELLLQHPWLSTTKLVVKPDMLFGQVGACCAMHLHGACSVDQICMSQSAREGHRGGEAARAGHAHASLHSIASYSARAARTHTHALGTGAS
jgi:hypothetical protein